MIAATPIIQPSNSNNADGAISGDDVEAGHDRVLGWPALLLVVVEGIYGTSQQPHQGDAPTTICQFFVQRMFAGRSGGDTCVKCLGFK